MPRIRYGRPSIAAASSSRPADTSQRIRELETIWPATSTGSTTSKGIWASAQNPRRTSTLPERLWPKKKLGPSTIAPAPKPLANDAVEERPGLQVEKGLVRGIDQEGVHSHLGEDFDLSLDPEQRFGGGLRPKQSHRRRIEGEHDGRPVDLLRHRPQSLHQPRMTQVDAVEVADGNRAAAERFGEIVEAAE